MQSEKIVASIYNQFEKYRILHKNSGFRIVPSLVCTLVTSLDEDLKRFEHWHGSENSEPHKSAAFFVYWFSKVKPIQIAGHHKHSNQITINESFGFVLAMSMLNIDEGRISDAFFAEFVYSLYYRDTNPKQMFFTFELLDRLNKIVPSGEEIV